MGNISTTTQCRKSWTEKQNNLNLLISLESAIKKSLMSGIKRERERERERERAITHGRVKTVPPRELLQPNSKTGLVIEKGINPPFYVFIKNFAATNKKWHEEQEKFKQLSENTKYQQIRKKLVLSSWLFFCKRVWRDTMTIPETAKYEKLISWLPNAQR
jgi:hypothetical protein